MTQCMERLCLTILLFITHYLITHFLKKKSLEIVSYHTPKQNILED